MLIILSDEKLDERAMLYLFDIQKELYLSEHIPDYAEKWVNGFSPQKLLMSEMAAFLAKVQVKSKLPLEGKILCLAQGLKHALAGEEKQEVN